MNVKIYVWKVIHFRNKVANEMIKFKLVLQVLILHPVPWVRPDLWGLGRFSVQALGLWLLSESTQMGYWQKRVFIRHLKDITDDSTTLSSGEKMQNIMCITRTTDTRYVSLCDAGAMMGQSWASVTDVGSTLNHHHHQCKRPEWWTRREAFNSVQGLINVPSRYPTLEY